MPVTAEDVPSLPYRVLVYGTLALPSLLVLFVLGVLSFSAGLTAGLASPGPGVGGAVGGGSAAGGVGIAAVGFVVVVAGVFGLATPILLYLDARTLERADIEWQPSPVLYAALGFLFTWLVLLHYLYKRQQHVVQWEGRDWWWVGVLGAVVVPLLVGVVGFALPLGLPVAAVGLSTLAFLLPLAFVPLFAYKDASYVRLNSPDWQPNPTTHYILGLAAACFNLFGLIPYLGYYFYKRHTAIGSP
jgi:hypothetical protein